mmetsp:Transcript_15131/g.18344  ORF Transcript_15131/g.18344 Transcript_15131/m.18344 type:complete len:126 (-) Transcript_15131:2156-2533(-)
MVSGDQTFEFPMNSNGFRELVDESLPFSTDEDGGTLNDFDPYNTVFDLSDDPISFFEDRLKLVKEIRLETSSLDSFPAVNMETRASTELELLYEVYSGALHICKFVGGIEMPLKNKVKGEIKPVS